MNLCVILIISVILPANTHTTFDSYFFFQLSCSDSVNETEWLLSLDQNEMTFEDYKVMQQISRLPPFTDPIEIPDLHTLAIDNREACLRYIKNMSLVAGNPPEPRDPPEIVIYPKHDVVPRVEKNFICFIANFYPPHMNINWTRNGVSVTEGVYISQFSLNSDGSFNVFSTLTSSLNEGDEYSCTVEHEALDSPQTRTWDVSAETPPVTQSEMPTVVFAVGIVVGFVGFSTVMYFVIKGSLQHRYRYSAVTP
ncbi:H-2 class II histocompatibility antigen, A-Q alpha chain-like [Clarias gariepinus]|uniref:H-2 class II histocompatibility antigen, A-Q alpha chain-like n=1 Tax=Clarias gariepinus TaxID=13013 RepID=UPI00234C060E|nr:H-2 class II histocompatibility antigen, A-Q alpha chain-like [Clarias gariepinus]